MATYICYPVQMRGSFVSSITTEGVVADNPPPDNLCIPGTGLTPVTCHVQCIGYDNHSNKTGTDTEHVNRTQSNESSDGLQLVEKDEGKMEQSLLCHIEPKKANGQERDNDALGSCASDTDVRELLESNNLKEIVGMDNKSLTVSEQDPDNCEETDQTDQPGLPDDAASAANTVRRGTEIQFRGLNLEENVSTLIGNRIVFTLECSRCKQRIDQQLSASGYVVTPPACKLNGRAI